MGALIFVADEALTGLNLVIARTLRELRRARGMTSSDLARRVGISVGHYRQIERGERQLNFRDALLLADAFGVSVTALRPPDADLSAGKRSGC